MLCCVLNGVESTLKISERGVPQGNNHDPPHFLVFINVRSRTTKFFNFFIFADDTSAVVFPNVLTEIISQGNIKIPKVTVWFASNKLMINERKTKYMILHRQARNVPLNLSRFLINNVYFDRVQQFIFLEVFVDSCLKSRHHLEFIIWKISKDVPIFLDSRKH